MFKAAILLLTLLMGSTTARAAPSFDVLFVRYEAQASFYELAIAQLAKTRATRPPIRTYAETLVNDHEAYNGALRELAVSKGIPFPSAMRDSDKKRLDRLTRLQGRAFDTEFVREARRVNGESLRSFRKEAIRSVDPDVRRFVARFLAVDEQHEAAARALSEGDVASRSSAIQPPRTGDTMRVNPPPSDTAMPVIPAPNTVPK
jgi:putative membrane protein